MMAQQVAAFKFNPFSLKQKKLLTWWMKKSPYYNFDMVIADGSVRSGKTVAMIDSFTNWSLHTFQNQSFIIAGKSMGALKRNVLRPMFQILSAKGIKYRYHRSEHYIEIGSNIYYCFGANNEASQDVLQGLTAAGALADEAALFPESFVEQMIARCSVEGSKVWMNCNPQGPHHYIKQDYINKARDKQILHLHFTLDDNLSLSPKIKERYKRLFSGLWFKRMILGLWVLAEGVIYDMFSEEKHVIDCPKKFPYYFATFDYGTSNPTTFGLYGYDPSTADGNLPPVVYLLKEYWYDGKKTNKQKTDAEYGDDFDNFIGDTKITCVYGDPSAASFIAELKKRRKWAVKEAINDVLDGIRFKAAMLSNNRFFIDRSCNHTILEYGAYIWDAKAQQRGEDKPLKQNDHTKDRDRYALYSHFSKYQRPAKDQLSGVKQPKSEASSMRW